MKWEIAFSTPTKEVYELWHADKKLLTLDFHPLTSSARIEYAAQRRVFLIRHEGFLRNKTVLCNEYGIRLGHIVYENNENIIELDGERYMYTIQDNPTTELAIYRESRDKPLVVCSLNNVKLKNSLKKPKKNALSAQVQPSLLLALGWYMFQPIARENVVEYA